MTGRAILEVDTNEELAKTLVANGQAYVERVAWPAIAQQHLDLYNAVLD